MNNKFRMFINEVPCEFRSGVHASEMMSILLTDESEFDTSVSASSALATHSVESIPSTYTNGSNSPALTSLDPDMSPDEVEEKARLISQVLELQNTLDDLSQRVDSVKEENLKLKSENQVLGQYIENLMSASSVFQSTSPKTKKKERPVAGKGEKQCRMALLLALLLLTSEVLPPSGMILYLHSMHFAWGTCESRCLESGASTDPSYAGHHTRTQGAPALETGTANGFDWNTDVYGRSAPPVEVSGVLGSGASDTAFESRGGCCLLSIHLGAGADPPAPPGTSAPKGRGVPPRTSAPQRKPGEPPKQSTFKGQLPAATDEPMDISGPKSEEDAPPSGSEPSLSVASDPTWKQKDPPKKQSTPRIKIDFKP
ncbi:hypothetical protein HPB47_008444 [Ixodes persulcatus]|uniref:Uncharacterized protein n=1 Tax=Ixodes persulcatus TaxID=34615 RepID=A0AC60P4R3_IXOPE|nr:hypothetical protein HPB47_008444 [Ixodes persulcatus]